MRSAILPVLALASFASMLLLGACDGSVESSPGGGGGSTTTGSTTTTTTTTTTTGTGGGGGQSTCGGLAGEACAPTEYCSYADGSCGHNDSQGTCLPRPGPCPPDCPGVCGCDGQFYCSECAAREAGVDVDPFVACAQPGQDQYSAAFWAGGLDHIILFKAEPVEDRCVMLFADWPSQNAPGFDVTLPDGWGISHAQITSSAADCAGLEDPPAGEIVQATGATGSVSWQVDPGMYAPCTVDVAASVLFAGAPPWAPAADNLSATAVPVENGCM
ncbi:MAG: hypothetical protein IT372_00230 [Polyangiaceae bacterium]|nr:hypothetical protein [Polyangiaceae bacterium]